ncbi:hypothetical protein OBV_29270 [Oscillibacter valericigenes Sjm18-20]|nr:hypothetical protein OBV_29270 [Oscillibacter valericigenes Sjm18-20]
MEVLDHIFTEEAFSKRRRAYEKQAQVSGFPIKKAHFKNGTRSLHYVTITSAILDRILQHCTVVNIMGERCCTGNQGLKRTAGILWSSLGTISSTRIGYS